MDNQSGLFHLYCCGKQKFSLRKNSFGWIIYFVAETNLKYQRLNKEFSEKKIAVDGVPKLKTLDRIFKERMDMKF